MEENDSIVINDIEYTLINRGRAKDMKINSDEKYEYISRVDSTYFKGKSRKTYWLVRCKKCNEMFITKLGTLTKCNNNCYVEHIEENYEYQQESVLRRLYIEEGMTRLELSNYFNISPRTIDKWLTEKYGLTENYRNSVQTVSDIQSSLIIGSLLGDGHIDKREEYPVFIVSHAENQKDYLFWKYNIMKKFCLHKPTEKNGFKKEIKGVECNIQKSFRFSTRSILAFKKFRDMSKSEVIESIDELAFSVFILDDGYLSNKKIWELCVASFSDLEKELFIKTIKNKFGIELYVSTSDSRYLKANVKESKKINDIILRNIPNTLDIIEYKILKKIGGGAE